MIAKTSILKDKKAKARASHAIEVKTLLTSTINLDPCVTMVSEKIPISPRTNPRIRVLSYEENLREVEAGLREVLQKNELSNFSTLKHGKPFSVRNEDGNDPVVVPLFISIDVWQFLQEVLMHAPMIRDLGTMITIGRAVLDLVKYLQRKHDEKKVHRFTINCSSTYYIALDFLRTQGVAIGSPLYFHSFGYQCITITSDQKRNHVAHIVIYSNEGELKDYVTLSV